MNPRLFKEHESPKLTGIRDLNGKPPSMIDVNYYYMSLATGCLFKPKRDHTQPKVSVLIQKVNIDTGQLTGQKLAIKISAISAGHMPPGSVIKFERGGLHGRVKYLRLYERIQFNVNFNREEGWRAYKPSIENHIIPDSIYNLSSNFDYYFKPSPYIKFKINNYPGISYLYVACFELFVRTYGSSTPTKRTLLNYSFDTVIERLTEHYDSKKFDVPGQWTLKPADGVTKLDIPLLAAMKYVRATQNIVKSIYSKFVTDGERKFPWFSPWFQGEGTLTVSGFKLPNGAFLGLRIEGFSVPDREITIIKDKEVTQDAGENTGHPDELPGPPKEKLVPGDGMGLDQENPPGNDGPELNIDEENNVEIYSLPVIKTVYNIIETEKPSGQGTGQTDETIEKPAGSASLGEPTDDESENSKAKSESPIEIDFGGTLIEMWNDLVRLHHAHPQIILSVEHYNYTDGFNNNDKPKLIAFEDPKELTAEEKEKSKRGKSDKSQRHNEYKRWITINDDEKRGLMVLRVTSSTQIFYCLETQRRLNKDESEESEHYTGMFFKLKDERNLKKAIKCVIDLLPLKKGKFKSVSEIEFFSFSDTYNHRKTPDQEYLYGSAIRKMMNKLNIDIQIDTNK